MRLFIRLDASDGILAHIVNIARTVTVAINYLLFAMIVYGQINLSMHHVSRGGAGSTATVVWIAMGFAPIIFLVIGLVIAFVLGAVLDRMVGWKGGVTPLTERLHLRRSMAARPTIVELDENFQPLHGEHLGLRY